MLTLSYKVIQPTAVQWKLKNCSKMLQRFATHTHASTLKKSRWRKLKIKISTLQKQCEIVYLTLCFARFVVIFIYTKLCFNFVYASTPAHNVCHTYVRVYKSACVCMCEQFNFLRAPSLSRSLPRALPVNKWIKKKSTEKTAATTTSEQTNTSK